jgi:hypothetical protein
MNFTIQNAYILGLASWLSELNLQGKYSRARSRFVAKLAERHTENDKFRVEIIEKYRKEDTDEFTDIDAVKKELQELFDEKYTVTIDGNDGVLLKELVLESDYKFGPKEDAAEQEKVAQIRQANDYNVWCESFEQMA